MNSAIKQYRENINRVRELGALAEAVERIATAALDLTDILRAQIVLAVSAADHFVHEVTRQGMIESAKGVRTKTDAYLRFQLPIVTVDSVLNGIPCETWLDEVVRDRHSWQSFQDPDKIADAIRLISSVKLWEVVGSHIGMQPQDVKIRLKLIVDRRNKIAHEADMDPANPGFRWPIDKSIVNDTINFVEQICEAIYKSVI